MPQEHHMPQNSTNVYNAWTSTSTGVDSYIRLVGDAMYVDEQSLATYTVKKDDKISPQLYFTYVKKKFGVLENLMISSRFKRMEIAFNKAVENGQEALGSKILQALARETRETMIWAKGFKTFIERDVLHKYKNKIKGGHISDTEFSLFTRVIPEEVLAKKKASEGLFDGYVIYHYWDTEAEEKREKKQKITPEEKSKMKDPILFGFIKESSRLYFIADWEDEYCDLTFDEICDVVGGKDKDMTLTKNPKLS